MSKKEDDGFEILFYPVQRFLGAGHSIIEMERLYGEPLKGYLVAIKKVNYDMFYSA